MGEAKPKRKNVEEAKARYGARRQESEPGSGRGRRLHPLGELVLARVREFVREPEAVFWVFVFPVLLALALGIAFRSQPVQKFRVAVEEEAPDAVAIARYLAASPQVNPVVKPGSVALEELRTGKVEVVVTVAAEDREPGWPEDTAQARILGRASGLVYIYDPTRPESRAARLASDDAIQRGVGRKDALAVSDRTVTEPGARYIDFLIPGLIGLNLMASGMWGIGFNVVESRTRKLLKLLTATPMRRSHYLLSFMLSRLLFLILEVAALVGFGRAVFGVRVHGSVLVLALILLAGALTFAGLGLLVASRSKSIEAVSGWMNLVMLPMWILSGSFFSYARFPEWMQPGIRLLPLTALNDALRAVINEGASLWAAGPQLAVLCGWGLVSFAVALRIFRWQ